MLGHGMITKGGSLDCDFGVVESIRQVYKYRFQPLRPENGFEVRWCVMLNVCMCQVGAL